MARLPIPRVDYDAAFAAQGGVCLLCGKRSPKRKFDRDHDHVTNRFRGLLCRRCNQGLAPFEWSVETMERLVEYLKAIIQDRRTFEENQ